MHIQLKNDECYIVIENHGYDIQLRMLPHSYRVFIYNVNENHYIIINSISKKS